MESLILDMVSRSSEELRKHSRGPGKRYVFSDHNNNPEGNIYTIVRIVEDLNNPKQHVEPHVHEYESLFIFKGNNPDLSGLEAEVMLGEKWYKISSPKTIRIPAGLSHTYRFLSGSGEYWNIVLTPNADYNKTVR